MEKLIRTVEQTGIKEIAVAGGVSANSGLKESVTGMGEKYGWKVYFPALQFTTDNGAMIAMTGYFRFLAGQFDAQDTVPMARMIL